MDFLHAIILAFVQGVTEFLPISSSGHLILLPKMMHWVDQGLEIDIAMHIGTLLAVVLYFYKDSLKILVGTKDILTGNLSASRNLALNIIIGTVPVVVVGFILKDIIEEDFRSALLVGCTSIIFGILLYVADRKVRQNDQPHKNVSLKHAAIIGLAQTLALVPGVSRSGITMTTALFLGYSRVESAKFSLLLSIPTTFAAGTLITFDIVQNGSSGLIADALLTGALSFCFAYMAIWGMMRWLQHYSFTPFVIYRVVLGVLLIGLYS